MKLPEIEVTFKQLAGTMVERSQRGIAILIIKDDTNKTFTYKEYSSITAAERDGTLYSAANMQAIRDVFGYALNKVCIVRVDKTGGLIADALSAVEQNAKTGWITMAEGTAADWSALVSWIKTKELAGGTYKAIVYRAAAPDCKHIVNFYNEKVTFVDERGEQTGEAYCPSLLGILANCNVKRGTTYFKCANLIRVAEVNNSETAVGNGQFVLMNDVDSVKVALGINSMTTTDGLTATEDMKYIDTVEVMDLIADDVSMVFKNNYLGSYKNNYDNQILLISAINTYFKQLAEDNILDKHYANQVDVDVAAQRAAWVGVGKIEAEGWTDQQVKNNAFKRTVFLAADIKVLGSVENMKFVINLA